MSSLLGLAIVAGGVWVVLNDSSEKHKWIAAPVLGLLLWLIYVAL